MKTTSKKKTPKPRAERKTYTLDHRATARKYYLMGLNLHEISKLTDGTPVRTLEKWQTADKWSELRHAPDIKQRVFELANAGYSYKQITELTKVSNTTVWRYITEVRNAQGAKQ